MKRLIMLATFISTAVAFGIVTIASAQESPTPQPTGTPQATGTAAATGTSTASECTGVAQSGGETVTIGQIEVTLPGGPDFTVSTAGTGIEVCYVDAGASVTISSTCDEIDRDNPDEDPVADAVLDDIVDSCERVTTATTPTPGSQGSDDDDVMTVTPTLTSEVQGTISPPSTGDAGLK